MSHPRLTTTLLAAAVLTGNNLASASSDHNHQQVLAWDGDCLPGPLSHTHHPSCLAAASTHNDDDDNDDENTAFDPKTHQPWTHRPYCPPNTSYCVHTSSRYRKHGVSYIAIPHSKAAELNETTSVRFVEVLLASEALVKKQGGSSESGGGGEMKKKAVEPKRKPYEVRDLPGKGKGVVATEHIPRGTVLIVEHAAVIADSAFPSRVKKVVGREMLQRAMARLGEDGERAILELARSGGEGVPAAEDLMRTNSFTVDVKGKSHMALFPRVARINHACRPSALTRFDEQTLSMTVRAMQDIEPGEEVTLSYSDFGLNYHARQQTLKSKWGFDCTCVLCSASPAEIAASDARRDKIASLGKKVIKHVDTGDWKTAIKTHRTMMEIIQDEALAPHMGDYYEVMTRLLAATKDMVNAKKYARLALEEFEAVGEEAVELEQFLKVA